MRRILSLWILLATVLIVLPGILSLIGGGYWFRVTTTIGVFAILTMIIIPILGCLLGFLADIVMSHIGIDLKHRELAEK